MLKYSELDKSKYYLRVLGVTVGEETCEPLCLIQDFYSGETFKITKRHYAKLLRDSRVEVLGQKLIKEYTADNNTQEQYVDMISIFGDAAHVAVMYKQYKGRTSADVWTTCYIKNGKVYGVTPFENDKELLSTLAKARSEYAIDYTDCFDSSKHKMIIQDGVRLSNNGICKIDRQDIKALCIPEGIHQVNIMKSNIDELILPSSCKNLEVLESKVLKMHLGGVAYLDLTDTTVDELYGIESVMELSSLCEGVRKVKKLVGKPRLFGYGSLNLVGLDVGKGILDLRECVCCEEILIDNVNCKSLIIPEETKELQLYSINKIGTIHIPKGLMKLEINNETNTDMVFEVCGKLSKGVMSTIERLNLKVVEYDSI